MDLERGCTFVNNLFLATRGFTREMAIGRFPEDVYPPEVLAEVRPHVERALLGTESYFERVMRMPSGEERWVRVRISPRRDAAGVVRGYYAVSTDIHEIHVAQAEIEDKERQLRQVIDSVPTPMCYVDADLRYRYVNNAFLDVHRAARRRTSSAARWSRCWARSASACCTRTSTACGPARRSRWSGWCATPTGRARWMVVRLTPRISNGEYLGYYATTSDIHEQKMVEEELRRANSILSAHFDNTPLAVIEWDPELRIVRWSGQAEPVFGWKPAEALGRSMDSWRLVYEDDEPARHGAPSASWWRAPGATPRSSTATTARTAR